MVSGRLAFRRMAHLSMSLGDCCSAVIRAVEDLDVSKVLPVGRQHGVLNSLEIVLKNISHLISAYLPKILQILLCMTAAISHILDQREKVRARSRCSRLTERVFSLGVVVGTEPHRLFRKLLLKPVQCFE